MSRPPAQRDSRPVEANGTALGAPDRPSPATTRSPRTIQPGRAAHEAAQHVYKALQRTLARGEALDTSPGGCGLAQAVKDWAMEQGATTVDALVPAIDRINGGEDDPGLWPGRRSGTGAGGAAAARSRSRASQTRHRSRGAGIRATFEALGYTAWDPRARVSSWRPEWRSLLCVPTAFTSWTGQALYTKIPLPRSMERCQARAEGTGAARRRGTHSACSRRSGVSRSTS